MAGVANEVTALASVKQRRLFIQERRRFDEAIAKLDDRWDYEIVVQRLYATRSLALNRYYWGVIVHELSEYTGFEPDEMHAWLKAKFIPKKLAVCDGNGEIVDELVLGGSTRKMTNAEFQDYCETIRRWAAEKHDVVIPDPESSMALTTPGHGWGV
jgi:hypothetical protein